MNVDPLNPMAPFEQTPGGQAAGAKVAGAEAARQPVADTAMADINQYKATVGGGPPAEQPFDQQQPMQDVQPLMRSAPLLIAITALGGHAARQSGLTMLNATNAMFKGAMAGNTEAYEGAKKLYDEAYQKHMEREKMRAKVYADVVKAAGNMVNADQMALEIADKAVGDARADYKNAADVYRAQLSANARLAAMKKQASTQAANARWFAQSENAEKQVRSIEQSKTRIDTANKVVQDMARDWPSLMKDLKAAFGPQGTTPVPISELIKKYGSDPRVGEFISRINTLKSALVVMESAGAGSIRSNQFIQQIFAKTAPDLLNMPASQVSEQIKIDQGMLGQFKGNLDRELQIAKGQAAFARKQLPGLSESISAEGDSGGEWSIEPVQ